VVALLLVAGLVAAGLAGALALTSGVGAPQADYYYYPTAAELGDEADAIVRGTVRSEGQTSEREMDEWVAGVDVTASAKGSEQAGSSIRVFHTGPPSAESVHLRAGDEYVFLLALMPDGEYVPVSSTQGVFHLDDGAVSFGDVVGPDDDVLAALEVTRET